MLEYQIEVPNEGFKNPLSGVMVDIEIINYTSKPWKQGDKMTLEYKTGTSFSISLSAKI